MRKELILAVWVLAFVGCLMTGYSPLWSLLVLLPASLVLGDRRTDAAADAPNRAKPRETTRS